MPTWMLLTALHEISRNNESKEMQKSSTLQRREKKKYEKIQVSYLVVRISVCHFRHFAGQQQAILLFQQNNWLYVVDEDLWDDPMMKPGGWWIIYRHRVSDWFTSSHTETERTTTNWIDENLNWRLVVLSLKVFAVVFSVIFCIRRRFSNVGKIPLQLLQTFTRTLDTKDTFIYDFPYFFSLKILLNISIQKITNILK